MVRFCLILAMALPLWANAQVKVQAEVDRRDVGLGEVITLQIRVDAGDSGSVQPPDVENLIDGFQVTGSSTGIETRSSYENGRFLTQQTRVFSYQGVVSKRNAKNKLVIPPLEVGVDGKAYKTNAIEISVADARKQPPVARGQQAPDPFEQGDDMEELFHQMLQRHFGQSGRAGNLPQGVNPQPPVNPNEAFFIQAQVDKTKAFVGEQVTTNFYLVTRGQIRDIDTLRYPDLKGFWKEDLEMATRLNFENIVINGIAYQRALLVSYALFPIKSGKATVDSYKAKCTVLTPSTFGFGRPYVFTKSSQPIAIEVEDVPQNRPPNYTGAVGNFRLSAAFEPTTGTTNQPVTMRVRVEGQGNAKLIELPKMALPPSFEIYDQKSQAKFAKDGTSYKEFEVLILPREPGVFQIPPIAISVFDPKTRKFTEVSSQALNISVTGTATPLADLKPPGDKGPQTPTNGSSEPAVPSLATEYLESHPSSGFLYTVTGLTYSSALAFLFVFGWRRLRGKPKKQSLLLVLKRRLKNVRDFAAQGEARRVGVEMTNTAYMILGQLSEEGGATQGLNRLLEATAPSLRNELAEPIRRLVSECEALSFAPDAIIRDLSQKGKMDQLIAEFEKVMSRAIELAEV